MFGRRQSPKGAYAAVIPRFIQALLEEKQPQIHGDGLQSRDFTYIDDVIQANLKACCAPSEEAGQAFNIAAGGRYTIVELFDTIAGILGKSNKMCIRDRYCKEHGIHMNGRPLGRPPKDTKIYDEQLRLEREESGERNAIEGKFGEGKRRFSLGLIMTKLQATSETQIHLVFLVMNLQKILRDLFILIISNRIFTKRRRLITVYC